MPYYNDKRAFDPNWIANDEEHYAALTEAGVSVEAASRIQGRPVRWLVKNVFAYDSVTLIAGAAGTGKTFFACQLAADASREAQLRVVLATSGAESPELLSWRLAQGEADLRRIALVNLAPKKHFKDPRAKPTEEIINERLSILYSMLLAVGDPNGGILPQEGSGDPKGAPVQGSGEETGNPKSKIENPKSVGVDPRPLPERPRPADLLVIDDLDGWLGKPGNLLPAAALARIIQRLNELARMLHIAIVVLGGTQLSVEGRMTSRQLSRVALAASVVWMLVKDREGGTERWRDGGTEEIGNCKMEEAGDGNPKSKIENPKLGDGLGSPSSEQGDEPQRRAYCQNARRWFMPVKNNLACDAEAYGRSFELVDGQVRWHADDPSPSLAEALLPSGHNTDRRRERNAAKEWIKTALIDGPLPSKEFFQQAFDSGYSKGTIRRAADELGIHSRKTGFNGGWEMRWVPQPVITGRGTLAYTRGTGFRIVGGEYEGRRGGQRERGRQSDGETEGRREREMEGRRDRAIASCAPSKKLGKNEAASWASSVAERVANCTEMCRRQPATIAPRRGAGSEGKLEDASCAPSTNVEEFEAASCAPSEGSDEIRGPAEPCDSSKRPHPGPFPKGAGVNVSCAPSAADEPTNPKSKIENPKSKFQNGDVLPRAG